MMRSLFAAPGLWLAGSIAVLIGCGPSEDEIRSIIQNELARQSVRSSVSDVKTIGPYSPAVRVGNFLFVSGQIALNPETQSLPGTDIESQTRQVMANLNAVLQKAGYDSSHVVHCTIYLKDINDFQRMNLIYGGYFPEEAYPSRTTVEVSNLPRNAIIEISAVAYKSNEP